MAKNGVNLALKFTLLLFYLQLILKTILHCTRCRQKLRLPSANSFYAFKTTTGECGSTVTSCRRNVLPCANIYDECPVGHKLVELKTECGGARSACVDRGAIVEDDAKQEYPNKCYTIDKITIMGQCVHQM